jgi:hypothetical protein
MFYMQTREIKIFYLI